MAFTYNSGNLGSSDLSSIRRLIGDVSSSAMKFNDAEINFYRDQNASIYGAAAELCTSIAASYGGQVSKAVGKLRIDASDKYKHYKDLADKYQSMATAKGSPQIFAGGISVSAKNTEEDDTDRVEPFFARGQFDIPGSITSSSAV